MLYQKRRRTSELTAGGKSLYQTRGKDGDWCQDADGLIGRHDRNRQRADRHQHDGNHQRGLAAVTVGIGTKNEAADRANQKRQSEGAEGEKQ